MTDIDYRVDSDLATFTAIDDQFQIFDRISAQAGFGSDGTWMFSGAMLADLWADEAP